MVFVLFVCWLLANLVPFFSDAVDLLGASVTPLPGKENIMTLLVMGCHGCWGPPCVIEQDGTCTKGLVLAGPNFSVHQAGLF